MIKLSNNVRDSMEIMVIGGKSIYTYERRFLGGEGTALLLDMIDPWAKIGGR